MSKITSSTPLPQQKQIAYDDALKMARAILENKGGTAAPLSTINSDLYAVFTSTPQDPTLAANLNTGATIPDDSATLTNMPKLTQTLNDFAQKALEAAHEGRWGDYNNYVNMLNGTISAAMAARQSAGEAAATSDAAVPAGSEGAASDATGAADILSTFKPSQIY